MIIDNFNFRLGFYLSSLLVGITFVCVPCVHAEILPEIIGGFQPPPGREQPKGGTASGGSRPVRNACISGTTKSQDFLTAVVPGNQLGLTMVEHPEFVVYLPPTSARIAELSIFDQEMEGVYQMDVQIDKRTGFIPVRLPNTAPTLEANKSYYWTFALVCNESDRTEDLVVGGWVERVPLTTQLRSQLLNASLPEKAALLAQNGYWYDAVTELLTTKPTPDAQRQLMKAWDNLLKSVGLNNIAEKSIHSSDNIVTYSH